MRLLVLLVLAAGSALSAGCSPRSYFADRWNDAKDVFTVAGSFGAGAQARIGPVHVGAIVGRGTAGLRNGEFAASGGGGSDVMELLFMPLELSPPLVFSVDAADVGFSRGKAYDMWSGLPFLTTEWSSVHAHYYSQIEVVAGVGVMVRLGFNPGELLDFVFGWFGVDIYGDDYYADNEPPPEGN